MSRLIRELFEMYSQDFDLVFSRDTDPIDLFYLQHTSEESNNLLKHMKELYNDILLKKKTINDIKNMGLEYIPEGNRSPEAWLPRLIKYMEDKLSSENP
jgi:hypothetical protein